MRRFIYKAEIEQIFYRYDIGDMDKERIKAELFKHPVSTHGKQFQLLDNIEGLGDIDTILDNESYDELFSGAVKDIFTLNEDLKMPTDIKRLLVSNEQVAVFIGAGVSKILGYPLWNELANNSIKYLREKNRISYNEQDKLKYEIADAKQKLSIFEKFCPRTELSGKQFYQDQLNNSKKNDKENPYKYLVSPYFNWLKITSNVEFSLADAQYEVEKEKFDRDEEQAQNFMDANEFRDKKIISSNFSKNSIDHDILYYLHGRIDQVEDSIFTTEDYINNYFKKETDLREFLIDLFENYNVIFVGYGLAELPILEAVMRDSEMEHFALMPTNYHERNIFQIKERYFRQLKIKPIPYFIDYDGYERLTDVLANWEKEIKKEVEKKPGSYLENLDQIDAGL